MKRLVILSLLLCFFMHTSVSAKDSTPTFFEANEVVYDKSSGKFTTIGKAIIDYNDSKLSTNTLEFDTNTDEIKASGDIHITGTDSIINTEEMIINTKNESVLIGATDIEFGENSYAKSQKTEMIGKDKIILYDVEYTACKEGLNDCGETPTWKIGANKITHDTTDGSLTYTNSLLYFLDIPILYLPYLINYTPDITNKTGLLFPSFGSSSSLGTIFRIPVFIKINEYNDMTLTPMFTSEKGMLFIGEYRTNQSFGTSITSGSFKPPKNDEEKRWYIKTENNFEINDIWRLIIDFERTSDDTYLRSYDFDSDPWLSSNIGLEGASGRSYLTANTYFYQDLRNLTDGYTPMVLPIIDYTRVSEPNSVGGFFDFNVNTAHIIREYVNKEEKDETSFRTSSSLKYSQPFKTSNGQLFNITLEGRADLYVLDDILQNTSTPTTQNYYTGSKSRNNITADIMWKYPLYRSLNNRTEILEPVIQLIASPKRQLNTLIPNMDSKYMELEAENLFSTNRFSGYDVFESGNRVNYGLNFVQNYSNNQSTTFFIGQNYNIDVPDNVYLENSGLKNDSGLSDIVASFTYNPISTLQFKYKTRISNSNFTMNRNDVGLYVGTPALNFSLNYIYLKNMYIEDELSTQKDEININLSSRITRNWSAFLGNRYNLNTEKNIDIRGGIGYENDCFKFNLNFINEFTQDRDYEGNKAVYFTFTFKTLGAISTNFNVSEYQ